MSLKAADWAAWVGAIGSILAICAGFGTTIWQNRRANELRGQDKAEREHDRSDRAEVVAFRLSGWLSEVGSRLEVKSELYDNLRMHNNTNLPHPYQGIADPVKAKRSCWY